MKPQNTEGLSLEEMRGVLKAEAAELRSIVDKMVPFTKECYSDMSATLAWAEQTAAEGMDVGSLRAAYRLLRFERTATAERLRELAEMKMLLPPELEEKFDKWEAEIEDMNPVDQTLYSIGVCVEMLQQAVDDGMLSRSSAFDREALEASTEKLIEAMAKGDDVEIALAHREAQDVLDKVTYECAQASIVSRTTKGLN
jgi:hypothetical protein